MVVSDSVELETSECKYLTRSEIEDLKQKFLPCCQVHRVIFVTLLLVYFGLMASYCVFLEDKVFTADIYSLFNFLSISFGWLIYRSCCKSNCDISHHCNTICCSHFILLMSTASAFTAFLALWKKETWMFLSERFHFSPTHYLSCPKTWCGRIKRLPCTTAPYS